MNINRAIIHEINKDQGTSAALDLSSALIPNDSKTVDLIEKLNHSFIQKNITHAKFDKSVPLKLFPEKFDDYLDDINDSKFIHFTKSVTQKLKNEINHVHNAKGGYFVYADYKLDRKHFVGIFLIRKSKTVTFSKNTSSTSFIIDEINHLDLEKLAMACRINITMYLSTSENHYLSFIKNKITEISDYFINWISVENVEDDKKYTNTLYELTSSLPLPLNADGVEMTIDDFRKGIYDVVNQTPNKIINLKTLGQIFYNNDQYITNFVHENDIIIDTEFKAEKSAIKKFVKINIQADGILLRFPRNLLNEKITIDSNRIIIDSSLIANKLREELDPNE